MSILQVALLCLTLMIARMDTMEDSSKYLIPNRMKGDVVPEKGGRLPAELLSTGRRAVGPPHL